MFKSFHWAKRVTHCRCKWQHEFSTSIHSTLCWYARMPGSLPLEIVEIGTCRQVGATWCPGSWRSLQQVIWWPASRRQDVFVLFHDSPTSQTLTVTQELRRQFKLLVGWRRQVSKVWQRAWCFHVSQRVVQEPGGGGVASTGAAPLFLFFSISPGLNSTHTPYHRFKTRRLCFLCGVRISPSLRWPWSSL